MRLGPEIARARLITRRDGFLQAIGHDLELEVAEFELAIDRAAGSLRSVFQAGSVRVRRALDPGVRLTQGDLATIHRHLHEDVLQSRRHPEISFDADGLSLDRLGEGIQGALELCGARRELSVRVAKAQGCWVARATVHLPDFGLVPFSAMLGALRVRPEVEVEITVPAEALSDIERAS